MSKKVLYTLLYISLLITPVYAQQEDELFNMEAYDYYDKACAFNEARDYMEAYHYIVLAEQSINASLSEKHIKASVLGDNEFRYPYWVVKKSAAEIAYMLGLYTEMETIADELRQTLREKEWEKADGMEETVKGMWADLAKIDGSRYYLIEKYDSSEVAFKAALRHGSFYGNDFFISKVHDDLAQLYYKQELYDKALAHLDSIGMSPLYQNDFRNKDTEQNKKTVQSQRALCLARLGHYEEALEEIEIVCSYFKKTNDKRSYAEALRKKAKILMLQYDVTGKYNPEALSCYQQYLFLSRNYIDHNFVDMSESQREQYWMAEQPFVTDCFRLEDKAPELLYDVALYSKAVLLQMGRDFREGMTAAERKSALASIRINWQQVRDKLPESACAIEFVVYDKKDQNHIGALVINKKSVTPQFIDLGDVTAISDYQLTECLKVKDVFADTQSRDK